MGFGAVTTYLRDSGSGPRKRTGGATICALAGSERTEHDKLRREILYGQRELSVAEITYRGGSQTES
jgi:hypothetical protein